MCGVRSSILHYVPLIETNNLYAPTPNGHSPSASLNKNNTPHCWALFLLHRGTKKTSSRNMLFIHFYFIHLLVSLALPRTKAGPDSSFVKRTVCQFRGCESYQDRLGLLAFVSDLGGVASRSTNGSDITCSGLKMALHLNPSQPSLLRSVSFGIWLHRLTSISLRALPVLHIMEVT